VDGPPFPLRTGQGLLGPGTALRLDGRPAQARTVPDGVLVTSDALGAPMPVVVRFALSTFVS
jgi:hypothetical protein